MNYKKVFSQSNISIFFTALLICGLNNLISIAETSSDSSDAAYYTDAAYLQNHGHSDDLIRMINLSKARAEDKQYNTKNDNKIKKFFTNLLIDPDITDPIYMFGDTKIDIK